LDEEKYTVMVLLTGRVAGGDGCGVGQLPVIAMRMASMNSFYFLVGRFFEKLFHVFGPLLLTYKIMDHVCK
jgi:hypothetical protein